MCLGIKVGIIIEYVLNKDKASPLHVYLIRIGLPHMASLYVKPHREAT